MMWAARRVRAPEILGRWRRTRDLRGCLYLIAVVVMSVAGMLAVVSVPRPVLADEEPAIREVVVQGNQRIEAATIATYLTIHEGDPFDPARIDRSLKNLFATGLFADVNIRRQNDTLVISVVENPIINRISFEGNKKIEDDKISPEIQLRPRVVYTRTKVQQDVEKILELYRRKGRFAARVEPKVIELPQNRVDLVYEISEGSPTYVRKITFIGNQAFSDGNLRGVVATREERWWRFLTSNDTYDPERLNYDRELLRRYYLQNGYADFEVISAVAELAPDRNNFYITITVKEGPRYKLSDVDLNVNVKNLPKEKLEPAIGFQKGDWYNAKQIDETINSITDAAGTAGYAFVDVRPHIQRNPDKKTISVVFDVSEGPRVFVERVDIKGNVRTLDRVIRREILLAEGDAFSTAKVRRSKERLENLGFFKKDSVKIDNRPSEVYPDRTILTAEVEEQSTGELQFGIGYSSASGALFNVGVRERNLLGKGQDLNLNFSIAQYQSQIQLSFTEPYFMDRRLVAGADLFLTRTNYQQYAGYISNSYGGSARLGWNYNEYLFQRFSYTLSATSLSSVNTALNSLYIQDQIGTAITSQVSQTIALDRRNNVITPSRGYYVSLSTDLAGVGGTERFVRGGLGAGWYAMPFNGWILGVNANTGYMVGLGRNLKIYERYQLGGDNLRGFDYFGASARDDVTRDAVGGDWIATISAELQIPLGLPKEIGITPKLFTDWGTIGAPRDLLRRAADTGIVIDYSGRIRGSAGIGVEWDSPVGPIRLDYAPFVFNHAPFDVVSHFLVNFGQKF
ncbi:MAG: outer membrane protein assembly factor BamA [Rhodospirillaceae bacterium]|nr:MAG: outer membrane protein assembly factor BamA [Rhodospirillaceae bacterium]